METQVFDTKPLLRPKQLADARDELKALEAKITDKGIEDKAEAMKQYRRVTKSVEEQTPRPPKDGEEEGRMEARASQLLAEIVPAMCSQEEMRKAPPGAVDKFMKGENSPEVKRKILEWKNLKLRLTRGEEAEAANLERYRPTSSTLNMDNAYIVGKSFHMPETSGPSVIFDDTDLAILRKHAPDIACRLATLDNGQRAELKTVLAKFAEDEQKAA